MAERVTKERIIKLLNTGWELGFSTGIRFDGYFWMQEGGLMKGGKSVNAHAGSVRSLEKQGVLVRSKQKGDPFWLTRYVLTEKVNHVNQTNK